MAKKKKDEDEGEESGVAVKEKKKEKKQLSDLYFSANCLVARNPIVIPVSPAVDLILGGGVPEGSFVIPTGKPKLGKTTICLTFAANALKPEYNSDLCPEGREIFFYNIEGRLKRRDLLGIHGLDINRVQIIGSKPGMILDGEDYMDIGERLINEKPGAIHIFDSLSQLCTKGEKESELSDRFRADAPVLLAKFCRRISNVIPINRSVVFGITHVIANQAGGGPMAAKWQEASGQKVQYAVDVKLAGQYFETWKEGDSQVGQDIHIKCTTSAIGPPGGSCVAKLRYGYGLDKEVELVQLAADFGLISRGDSGKSAWYTFPDGSKANGIANARAKLIEEPTLYDSLNKQLRAILGFDNI